MMFVLLLLTLSLVLTQSSIDERIVGGTNALIVEYPYQISLQYFGNHICGGSIIGPARILTAAHCSDGTTPRSLTVRYGTTFVEEGGSTRNITSIRQHPSYNPDVSDYDVSVLTLGREVYVSLLAKPVNLVPADVIEGGRIGVVTGWGARASGGGSSRQLQAVQVEEVDCSTTYGEIFTNVICFESLGKDACQGDSGGPLVVDDVQVGIISVRYDCADSGYPGVYTNIAKLRSFIDSN